MDPTTEQIRAAREVFIGDARRRLPDEIELELFGAGDEVPPSASVVRRALIAAQKHDPVYKLAFALLDAGWQTEFDAAVERLHAFLRAAAPTEEEDQT